MSGMICPDCGLWPFEDVDEKTLRCTICGWTGPPGPRKKLYPDDFQRRSREVVEKKSRRASGLLFYIRIYADVSAQDDLGFLVLDVLGIQEVSYSEKYLLIEMKRRPTHDEMSKLEALPGVQKITVF